MRHAFKEWAAVCAALASARQAIILRKGGIAEPTPDGLFQPEHSRFWLYPTYLHQQRDGIIPEALPLLDAVVATRPVDRVRLTHFVEVAGVYHVSQLVGALLLDELHIWSEATVRQRFEYRTPGLFVLTARVFAMPEPVELPELPEYAGCKTWVDFGRDVSIEGAVPVLDDRAFERVIEQVSARLNPIATA